MKYLISLALVGTLLCSGAVSQPLPIPERPIISTSSGGPITGPQVIPYEQPVEFTLTWYPAVVVDWIIVVSDLAPWEEGPPFFWEEIVVDPWWWETESTYEVLLGSIQGWSPGSTGFMWVDGFYYGGINPKRYTYSPLQFATVELVAPGG